MTLTVLPLLQQFSEPDTPVKELLGGSVQVRAELGEGRHLTVLSQLQLHGTGHLLNLKILIFFNSGDYLKL